MVKTGEKVKHSLGEILASHHIYLFLNNLSLFGIEKTLIMVI
jgi:hypothetical protein